MSEKGPWVWEGDTQVLMTGEPSWEHVDREEGEGGSCLG